MRRCAGCGQRFSARDMRTHVPVCAGGAVRPGSRKRKKVKRAA
jgi:hypothetical protein